MVFDRPQGRGQIPGRRSLSSSAWPTPAPRNSKRGPKRLHSDRLALVALGNKVVGYFDTTSRETLDALLAKAKALAPAPPKGPACVPASSRE